MHKKIKYLALLLIIFPIVISPLQLTPSGFLNVAKSDTATINIWWPTQNAAISGVQPFKALLNNWSVRNYQMYWQVDGGQWNWMTDSYTDYAHKEANVDASTWNWRGNGPYTIHFIATDLNNNIISQQAVDVSISQAGTSQISTTLNPVAGTALYVNPNSRAKQWATANAQTNPSDAAIMNKIASQPTAQWFGDWNTSIANDVGAAMTLAINANGLPIFVAYNIPHRDCGSYSSGGATSASAYKSWILAFAKAIGSRRAVVVLEPDALASISCLSSNDQQERISLLQYAVTTFENQGNISLYIDAGNPHWIDAATMASRLKQAYVNKAQGFIIDTSNFFTTQDNISYGQQISTLVGNKHFIIDTSRNGLGSTSDYQWCNPPGRALGQVPTATTGNALVDAYLWIKNPTESDGNCNGGPSAGVFWPSYVLSLAKSAGW
jgi:endoglucanase